MESSPRQKVSFSPVELKRSPMMMIPCILICNTTRFQGQIFGKIKHEVHSGAFRMLGYRNCMLSLKYFERVSRKEVATVLASGSPITSRG
jgi:hypothetical protein